MQDGRTACPARVAREDTDTRAAFLRAHLKSHIIIIPAPWRSGHGTPRPYT